MPASSTSADARLGQAAAVVLGLPVRPALPSVALRPLWCSPAVALRVVDAGARELDRCDRLPAADRAAVGRPRRRASAIATDAAHDREPGEQQDQRPDRGRPPAAGRRAAEPARRRGAARSASSSPVRPARAELGEARLELRGELVHRREPLPRRSFASARSIAAASRGGDVRPALAHARRRLVDVPHRDRDEVLARERQLAGRAARRARRRASRRRSARSTALAARLLGRDVVARAEHRAGLRDAVARRRASARSRSRSPSPRPSPSSSTFCGFTSRWHEPVLVRERERRARSASASSSASSHRERRLALDQLFRFSPATYSKTMNWRPSCSPRSMTVTMFGCESAATDAGLVAEALDVVVVRAELLVQDLERDVALEQAVVRPIDARHAARADELLELVPVRDQLADHDASEAVPVPCDAELTATGAVSSASSQTSERLVELGVGEHERAEDADAVRVDARLEQQQPARGRLLDDRAWRVGVRLLRRRGPRRARSRASRRGRGRRRSRASAPASRACARGSSRRSASARSTRPSSSITSSTASAAACATGLPT